jgi:hypothetical protein
VSEQLLNILKLALLALLYLFFFRVLRAVWAELKPPKPVGVPAGGAAGGAKRPPKSPKAAKAPKASKAKKGSSLVPSQLLVVEPVTLKGMAYPLGDDVTLGRAAGCQITLDDNFVSQLHTRIHRRDGNYVVEDLGSTNGTYLNRTKVGAPMVMQRGDRLQVGNIVLELV